MIITKLPQMLLVGSMLVLNAPEPIRAAQTDAAPQTASETPEQKAARMKWFNEARFGMFIHWGVYSVPAGEWKDQKNYGEWFLEETHMPVSEYEKFSDQFNPVKFDAKEWVRMAKDAGMKYIVITSKHHDGFGLWDSKLTDWDIGRTPFNRDPLKDLAEACNAAGIKLCLYHSIMDWHHPDWGKRRQWHDLASGEPDMDRYVAYMKAQLKELITRYHPALLWFDGEWESPWTHERGVDLYNYLHALDPNLIINNRIGKGRSGMAGMDKGQGVGDYGTPEQEIPPTGFGPGVAWESCMTMNDHWGYNKHDQNWKSTQTLIRNLIDCASKGGNYLLNVGPTAEGLFPAPSVERLRAIGEWMNANRDSIYGTEAGPFRKLPWGRCTQKSRRNETVLYLHVFDWPIDGKLLVPGLQNEIKSAVLLKNRKKLKAAKTTEGIVIELPKEPVDSLSTTIALRAIGKPEVEDFRTTQRNGDALLLNAVHADLSGHHLRTETMDGKINLGFWSEPEAFAQWPIRISRPGNYLISAELSGEAAGKFIVEADGQKLTTDSLATGAYRQYGVKTLGSLRFSAGNHNLIVRPVAGHWQPMNLRWIKLVPQY